MTDARGRVDEIVEHLLKADAAMATDIAKHAGDRVFEVVKMHGMTMPTAAGSILLGCLIARQVLGDTIEFARRTMEGDGADEAMIRRAVLSLFDELRAEMSHD